MTTLDVSKLKRILTQAGYTHTTAMRTSDSAYRAVWVAAQVEQREEDARICDEQASKDRPNQLAGSQSDDYITGYTDGSGDCGHAIRSQK